MSERLSAWAVHELALRAASEALAALAEAGVRAVPVKGLVLARTLYADPADRPIRDVDVFVPPRDLGRALEVARARRWPVVWDSKTLRTPNFVVGRVAVDVATSLGPMGLSALGVEEIVARARPAVAPLGFAHLAIDPNDHALLLAIDAFKDKLGLGKASARGDLERIVAAPGVDAAVIAARAREAKLATAVSLVAAWVAAETPGSRWREVRERLSPAVRPGYVAAHDRALARACASRLDAVRASLLVRIASDSGPRRLLALGLGAAGTLAFVARHGSLDAEVWAPWRRARGAGRDGGA